MDSGSGVGNLVIGTTSMGTTLVTIPLQKPSFSISSGVATAIGVPISATASATGTAAAAQIQDSAGNIIVNNLSVGTSGSDVTLNSTSIASGETVTMTSATITAV